MNSESKSKFNLWLSEHPESFHPSDEARMFDLVNTLYETEGSVCIDTSVRDNELYLKAL